MQKMIPPFLFLVSILTMVGLSYLLPLQILLTAPLTYLGILFLLIGLGMTVSVRRLFDQTNTEIHTFKRPRKLVTKGLFKYSRNPIYLGFSIALTGVGLLLGTLSPLFVVPFFVLITNYWYIPYEERMMEENFGVDYISYKQKVRRWI